MSSILLIGGNGSLARTMTKRFSSKGVAVHSVIRNANQIPELTRLGASPVVLSVEAAGVPEFTELIKDTQPDVVIWSAGAGAGSASDARIWRVDAEGHIKVADAVAQAANEAGTTRRLISISALEVRNEANKPVPEWYNTDDVAFSNMIRSMLPTYFRARLAADQDLVLENQRRRLEYTIVRPGWMSSGPGTGRIEAGRCRISGQVSREDVTSVVELCMSNRRTVGLAFDVAGGNTPIEDAVANATDSFEGFY